jgi:hypothetical protein
VKRYLLLLLGLVGVLVAVELSRPAPLDLRVRLEREGSAPFDAEVFYEALPAWVGAPVEPVAQPPFERLEDSTVTGRTYAVITQSFTPDEAEARRLLRFVWRGNTLFVAATGFGGPLGEALGAPADSSFDGRRGLRTEWAPTPGFVFRGTLMADTLRLVAPGVEGAYGFPVGVAENAVVGLDSARSEVLGRLDSDLGPVSLARVRYGEGQVILSSTPLAFSNAALTGPGDAAAYVGAVLAALPEQPVWWDDHSKPYGQYAQTPLRYVLQTPALRWAYGLLVLAFVLFVVFRGRRWQRPIPVVAPPPNAQREFARVLGRLHFLHGDERRLAARKARVFRDRLRTQLGLADADLSAETARRAAAHAGVPEDEARALFATLDRVARERRPDADALVRLDGRIDAFFRHAPGRPADATAPSARPPTDGDPA